MQDTPFLFAIPLLAKAVARDWERVSRLLASTMDSILHQTDGNFSVVLACHDAPDIAQLNDPRVVILKTDLPIPATPDAQMFDKGHKKRMGFAHLRQLGGGWVMPIDADDLVSKHLVAYVRRVNAPHGMLIDEGWEFDCATRKLTRAARFNRMCGSSAVFRFGLDDLPAHAQQEGATVSDAFESHRLWREQAASLNRPLTLVDFRAAAYTINNQQNHSVLTGNIGWKRKLWRLASWSHTPTAAELDEFSMAALMRI